MSRRTRADASSCPFLNMLVHEGAIKPDNVDAQTLTLIAARCYGIDAQVMRMFANASVDKVENRTNENRENENEEREEKNRGNTRNTRNKKSTKITLSKFLRPSTFPVHRGALARADGMLATVDERRLALLASDARFSTRGRISHKQLEAYQSECWRDSSSRMTWQDKVPAIVELELLWRLFGAYEDENHTLPLDLLCDFLHHNHLPRSFLVDRRHALSRFGLFWTLFRNGYKLMPC